MTVVLALRCADGVVLASDSQITDPGRGLSYPAQKLHSLGSHAAWGGSGSRAVLHDIERLFDAEPDAVVEASDVGRALQARVLPIFKHHYANFITDVPESEPGATPATYVLAAGYAGGEPFIVDIDPHGLIGHHEEIGQDPRVPVVLAVGHERIRFAIAGLVNSRLPATSATRWRRTSSRSSWIGRGRSGSFQAGAPSANDSRRAAAPHVRGRRWLVSYVP
jgi:hypothetical protein